MTLVSRSLTLAATALHGASSALPAYKPNWFEAASPFLITIFLIIISAWVMPDIIERIGRDFAETRAKAKEIEAAKRAADGETLPTKEKKPPPDQAPETQATASIWAIDTAQIPMMIGTPAASAVVLHEAIPKEFALGYAGVLTLGVAFFLTFRRWMPILWYASRGPTILGVQFSLLVLTGISLNVIGAVVAAIFIG